MLIHKAYILEITYTDYISQEEKEEEDLPVSKTVSMHRYKTQRLHKKAQR